MNSELAALESVLPQAVAALAVGGRIAVLAYHSLEDRLVKQVLAAGARETAPPGLPVVPEEYQPRLRLLTRGADKPTEAEIAATGAPPRPGSAPPNGSGTPGRLSHEPGRWSARRHERGSSSIGRALQRASTPLCEIALAP